MLLDQVQGQTTSQECGVLVVIDNAKLVPALRQRRMAFEYLPAPARDRLPDLDWSLYDAMRVRTLDRKWRPKVAVPLTEESVPLCDQWNAHIEREAAQHAAAADG